MSIPSWARKGAKVVCIKGGTPTCDGAVLFGRYPTTGITYTVSKAFVAYGVALLNLEEVPVDEGLGWNASRFRPLVDDAKDNEVEAQIYRKKVSQKPAPIKELERVE